MDDSKTRTGKNKMILEPRVVTERESSLFKVIKGKKKLLKRIMGGARPKHHGIELKGFPPPTAKGERKEGGKPTHIGSQPKG